MLLSAVTPCTYFILTSLFVEDLMEQVEVKLEPTDCDLFPTGKCIHHFHFAYSVFGYKIKHDHWLVVRVGTERDL